MPVFHPCRPFRLRHATLHARRLAVALSTFIALGASQAQGVVVPPQVASPTTLRLATTLSTLTAPDAQGVAVAPLVPAPNTLALALNNVGLTRCQPALERLSSFGVQGTRANDVLVDWDRKRPATSSVFALIGLEYAHGGGAMAVASVPEADGSCSLLAERITVASLPCASVAEQELRGMQRTQLLPNFSAYTDPNDRTSSVSLIDSAPGCLVIRRYVEFNWKDAEAGNATGTGRPPGRDPREGRSNAPRDGQW